MSPGRSRVATIGLAGGSTLSRADSVGRGPPKEESVMRDRQNALVSRSFSRCRSVTTGALVFAGFVVLASAASAQLQFEELAFWSQVNDCTNAVSTLR